MTRINSQVKVLIAERALSMAELIARNLRLQGYTIAGIVSSAEKAIEFATITAPDVVLLDLPIPGEVDVFMAGWKILNEIRCPVVYMTTQRDDVIRQVESLNPWGFLVKPFTAEELKTAIDETLRQYRSQQFEQHETQVGANSIFDEQILRLLTTASALLPMPRIFFAGSCLQLYAHTLDGAIMLKSACRTQHITCPYQIFFWSKGRHDYQLYDYNS